MGDVRSDPVGGAHLASTYRFGCTVERVLGSARIAVVPVRGWVRQAGAAVSGHVAAKGSVGVEEQFIECAGACAWRAAGRASTAPGGFCLHRRAICYPS